MGRTVGFGLVAAAFVALVTSMTAVGAQQQQQQQQQGAQPAQQGNAPAPAAQPPAAPAARPLIPVAANTVATNPDAYFGQPVTVTASVERILSRSAFVIAQRTVANVNNPNVRKELLVVVPTIQGPVDQGAYVTVFGEVVKFDPAEIAKKAKDYKIDLAPELVAEYSGKPAVVATGLLNAAMTDLAKRLPPPMTADEQALQKIMRRIQPALGELRKGVEASAVDVTSKNAVILKEAFTENEAFWKKRNKSDATQWAQGGRKNAEAIEKAVATAKWDEVKTEAGALGQVCQTCHTAYRERFDDGSFRIKKG